MPYKDPEQQRACARESYRRNREVRLARLRAYYAANPEHCRALKRKADRRWYAKPRNKASRATQRRRRRQTCLAFRLRGNLSCRLYDVVRHAGSAKLATTMRLVGCSGPELVARLVAQFLPGMTKRNYGLHGWHIDHIIPCEAFALTNVDAQRACFHYSNLRPLWAKTNISRPSWVGPKLTAVQVSALLRKQAYAKLSDLGIIADETFHLAR